LKAQSSATTETLQTAINATQTVQRVLWDGVAQGGVLLLPRLALRYAQTCMLWVSSNVQTEIMIRQMDALIAMLNQAMFVTLLLIQELYQFAFLPAEMEYETHLSNAKTEEP